MIKKTKSLNFTMTCELNNLSALVRVAVCSLRRLLEPKRNSDYNYKTKQTSRILHIYISKYGAGDEQSLEKINRKVSDERIDKEHMEKETKFS